MRTIIRNLLSLIQCTDRILRYLLTHSRVTVAIRIKRIILLPFVLIRIPYTVSQPTIPVHYHSTLVPLAIDMYTTSTVATQVLCTEVLLLAEDPNESEPLLLQHSSYISKTHSTKTTTSLEQNENSSHHTLTYQRRRSKSGFKTDEQNTSDSKQKKKPLHNNSQDQASLIPNATPRMHSRNNTNLEHRTIMTQIAIVHFRRFENSIVEFKD